MTISITSPTSTTSKIQQNGSDVLTVDSSNNVTVTNNLSVSGTVSSTGAITFDGGVSGDVNFDSGTLYVDATNNRVGIGTSSPHTELNVQGGIGAATATETTTKSNALFSLSSAATGTKLYQGIESGNVVWLQAQNSDNSLKSIGLNPVGGNVLVNTSSAVGSGKFVAANNSNFCATMNSVGNGADYIQFWNGSQVGSITRVGGTNVAYNTSSDYRLKENVALMSGSIDRLKKLKPSTWTWRQDGSHGEGFIAHEAQTVIPEAVTGTKDAMRTEEYEVTPEVLDDDGNVVTRAVMRTKEVPDYQGIDQSKLVPLLTAALQEAITKIEDLETRIQTLENPS